MTEKLQALYLALGGLRKDMPEDEAKAFLRQALPLFLDLSPTEVVDALEWLKERAPVSKEWLRSLQREIAEAKRKSPILVNEPPTEEKEPLRALAASLMNCNDVLAEAAKAVEKLGVAGQVREVKLLYLILTSRVFPRPVNAICKGASSGGKSFLVETVLQLFPASAHYCLSAMSEKALAYSREPLSHRFLVIFEAAGLGTEFAQYLMRSLLTEGRVRYETVEKTKTGLVCRLIEREGPTGLIVTTTKTGLHPENETRMLSLEIDDSPAQTRAVLLAQAAAEVNGHEGGHEEALAAFRAFQRLLELDPPQVCVPFAHPLAEGCNFEAVRLRRDFQAVLTLIKAHAALHAARREKTPDGQILADRRDYEAVFQLVADLIAHAAGAKVDPAVRQLVEAVKVCGGEDGITVKRLATYLGWHHLRAWRASQKALKEGYLVNHETKRGAPTRLALGDPVPPDGVVLPLPEKIFSQYPGENNENVKTDGKNHYLSESYRFHPSMKTLENGGENKGAFSPVFTPHENGKSLEPHDKVQPFSGFHGFPGDNEDLFEDEVTIE